MYIHIHTYMYTHTHTHTHTHQDPSETPSKHKRGVRVPPGEQGKVGGAKEARPTPV